jgi:ABC-type sulfate transport system substrate-binding protein
MNRALVLGLSALLAVLATVARAQHEILNASYDISRERFAEVNKALVPAYRASGAGAVAI